MLALGACSGRQSAGENTLSMPLGANPKTFDPADIGDLYSGIASSLVYEGLYEYHYLKRPHALEPLVAEGLPKVSADGKTYTIKIRSHVKFADHSAFEGGKGRAVTANDFIYSWKRIADPKLPGGNFWLFDGRIKGFNEWREKQKSAAKTNYDDVVEGLRAPDAQTLVIQLNRPFPQLNFILAMPQAVVVAREVVEKTGKDFVTSPVGTGPYKLVTWLQNSRLTYEKNKDWHGQAYPTEGEAADREKGLLADAGKPLPFADKVEFNVFTESQPMWLNFMKGSIDYTTIPKDNYKSAIDAATKELLPELSSKGVSLQKAPQSDLTYTAFNMEDPVIQKAGPNLRKAIALAIDGEREIELFSNGRAMQAHFIIPPPIAGFDPSFVSPFSKTSLEQAKEYLAKAGYPEGKGLPELVYETGQGTDSRQRSEFFQKELAKIGIQIRVNVNQFAELTEKINQKKGQIWGIAWGADYPDAENFLQLLYGPNQSPGPNGSNFNDPTYNKLFEKVRDMSDSPERRVLIGKMRDIFIRELPVIPESHRVSYTLTHSWFKNWKPEYMGHNYAKFLRVDFEKRKQGFK